MKRLFLSLFLVGSVLLLCAQEDSTGEARGFKKENLFTGGTISLGFGDRYFQAGANPMLGYSLTKWADAGIVVNYIHTSFNQYSLDIDKKRIDLYGGGPFVRVYPLRFLFVHGQVEHNFVAVKNTLYNGGAPVKYHEGANSLLVGPGYTTGRQPGSGGLYGYLSIMWDLMSDTNSPYIEFDSNGEVLRRIPIVRAGVILPLFQGKQNRY